MRRVYLSPQIVVADIEEDGMLAASTGAQEEPVTLEVNVEEQVLDGLSFGEWGASDMWDDD